MKIMCHFSRKKLPPHYRWWMMMQTMTQLFSRNLFLNFSFCENILYKYPKKSKRRYLNKKLLGKGVKLKTSKICFICILPCTILISGRACCFFYCFLSFSSLMNAPRIKYKLALSIFIDLGWFHQCNSWIFFFFCIFWIIFL